MYPNFESRESLGKIGWGVDKPSLQNSPRSLNESMERIHVKHWDNSENQKFIKLTGEFSASHDKSLQLNPEIYHLMNASA